MNIHERRAHRAKVCCGGEESHADQLEAMGECGWCHDISPELAEETSIPEFAEDRA